MRAVYLSIWLLVTACTLPTKPSAPLPPEQFCSDNLDQDEDGELDCSDADCIESLHCRQQPWQPEPAAVYEGPARPPYETSGFVYRHLFEVRPRPLYAPDDGGGVWLHIHDPGTDWYGGNQLFFAPPFDDRDSLKLSRAFLRWNMGDWESGNFQSGDFDCDGRQDLAYLDYYHEFFNVPSVGWDPHCPVDGRWINELTPGQPLVTCSVLYLWFGAPERDWASVDLSVPDAWLYDLTDMGRRAQLDHPLGWDSDMLVSADFDGDRCSDLFFKRTVVDEANGWDRQADDQPTYILFGEPALRELRGTRAAESYPGLLGRPYISVGSEAVSMEATADFDNDGRADIILADNTWHVGTFNWLAEDSIGLHNDDNDPASVHSMTTTMLCAGRPRWTSLQVREQTCRALYDPSGQWRIRSSMWLAVDATGDGVLDLVGAYILESDLYALRVDYETQEWDERSQPALDEEFPAEGIDHPTQNGVLVLYQGPIDPHGNEPLLATAMGWNGPVQESGNNTALAPGSGRPGEPAFWVATGWDLPSKETIHNPLFTEINSSFRPARSRFYGIERLDPNDTRPLEFVASVWFPEQSAGDTSGVGLDTLPLAFSNLDGALVVAAPYAVNQAFEQVGRVELYRFSDLLGP